MSSHTYGSPPVWKDLVVGGERCGQNRVARLMRMANMPTEARARDRVHALLREKLSADVLQALLAQGAKLTEDEACRLALDD